MYFSNVAELSHNAQYQDVDEAVYDWYRLAREWLVPGTGPMLQEEVLVMNGLGHSEFKASNGWLQRFKDRHHIKVMIYSLKLIFMR